MIYINEDVRFIVLDRNDDVLEWFYNLDDAETYLEETEEAVYIDDLDN